MKQTLFWLLLVIMAAIPLFSVNASTREFIFVLLSGWAISDIAHDIARGFFPDEHS